MYIVHIFPTIACLLNTFYTNCILKESLWIAVAVLSVIYHCVNYSVVKFSGYVMYWMLNFNDGIKSWIWVVVLSGVPILVYVGLCRVDKWLKKEWRK